MRPLAGQGHGGTRPKFESEAARAACYIQHEQGTTRVALGSMFIDQAALNGTRPNLPVGAKPAMTPGRAGCLVAYGSVPRMGPTPEDLSVSGLVRWPASAPVKEILAFRLVSIQCRRYGWENRIQICARRPYEAEFPIQITLQDTQAARRLCS